MRLKEIGDLTVDTHIRCLQEVFDNGIVKGSLYCIVAPTNTGKTTFLLGIAKRLARQGKQVTFITQEQSIEQMSKKIGQEPLPTLDIEQSLDDVFYGSEQPDYIIYDYIGGDLDLGK